MSWVTVIWSLGAGACLTLAFLQFIVWWKDRTARANLVFSIGAVAVAVFAALEFALMRTETPEAFGRVTRWIHVPGWVLIVSIVAFVRLYLNAGRRWLAWTIVAVRTLSLILNFLLSPNINYREITSLRHVRFLGEFVSIPHGVPNPWMLVAQFSLLLLVIYVVDAAITVWRLGDRRRAVIVGGSIVLLVVLASAQAVAMTWGLLSTPLTVSVFYLIFVAAMAYELSYDLIRAAKLTRQLQVSEAEVREIQQRMDLAASAADLGIWVWDIVNDEIWVSEKEGTLFGFAPSEKPDIQHFRNAIHPDDRASMRKALENSLNTGTDYEAEHRVVLPNGQIRWLTSRGRVEASGDGKPARMRGVSLDITRRKKREAALLESEARFRTMADMAPVLIWMSGPDKLCTFFNKPWLEFTGRTIEQEMGNGWAEGVHPDDFQNCLKTYVEAFDAREAFVMQYRLRRADGEYRWVSDNGVPRYDAQKNFAGYIGSCVDITELRSKDEALREFEERVVLAAEAAHLGVWEMDPATNELWMSDSGRSLFGFDSHAHLTHAVLQNRLHPDDRALRDSAVKAAIENDGEYELEYRAVLPDGSVRWIGERGRCVSRQDKGSRVIGVSIDITERKQAEELFRLATEASPSGLVLVNDQGRIVLVNSHVEELFGYRREELLGRSMEILVPERFAGEHPAHRANFLAAPTARAMGAGRELFARRKNGSEFPVEIGLNPIETPDGILVLAAVVDISARLAAEEETRRSREQVELLGRVSLLGEMTASLAHELNQPLGAIVNNASAAMQYLEQGRLDPEKLRDILTDVAGDGHRAYDIMHNVRNAIKKGSAIRGWINLNDVVKAVTHMVQPDAVAQLCKVETSFAADLPAIEGDPTQIQQVLINLVRNAFDAMRDTPPSRRTVEIATNRSGDGTICVSVRDHGSGISQATRERLFEPFFTTKEEGLGMGLAIVRSIVEAHGGSIAAENANGGGARFHFRLPIKEETLE